MVFSNQLLIDIANLIIHKLNKLFAKASAIGRIYAIRDQHAMYFAAIGLRSSCRSYEDEAEDKVSLYYIR